MTTAQLYREILKYEVQPDGTLMVYGLATDPTLDSDDQICDETWLKSAMPAWFEYGNVREMHTGIAAGVATELDTKGDGHWIRIHVVDPGSCAKVIAKVLKGLSVGIRNVRVVADKFAAGGRIIGGDIVEVSLVDRPANPSCILELAKAAGGIVLQVENLIEKDGNTVDDCKGCGKSAALDDDKNCADCAAKAVAGGDDEGDASSAESTEAGDTAEGAGGDDEGKDDAAEGSPEEEASESDAEAEAEGDTDEPTLASIAAQLTELLALLQTASGDTKALEARVTKAEKAANRPARARTDKSVKGEGEADAKQAEYDELIAKADGTPDTLLAKGYRRRAAELLPQLTK